MWINFHIFYKDDVKYLMHKVLLYYGVEKLNIKYLAIVLFFVLVIFSISAVSAANETVADDVNEISDSSIDSINPSNSNGSYNIIQYHKKRRMRQKYVYQLFYNFKYNRVHCIYHK